MRRTLLLVFLSAGLLVTASAQPRTIGGCQMFPANNVWNTPVDTLAVSASSATYVNTIGATAHLFPDFWSNVGGLFLNVAPASQPRVPVTARYSAESDPGPYPIPPDARVQAGSDLHLIVIDSGNCKLYEMWDSVKQADGSWSVGAAAIFDLHSNILRPPTWTAASAAGLPIMPGTVTFDEVAAGQINHAIGMTVPHTQDAYVWPATHEASSLTGSQYPPMGARFRLKAGFDVTPYPAEVQVILKALKKYGAMVDDNGAAWFLNGLQDPRWNNTNLHTITQVLGSNMEAVDTSHMIVAANSAVVAGSPVALDGIYVDHRQVAAGTPVNGQVILTAPAPAGGAVVSLVSSNPAAATAPASVAVPAGSATASFKVTINSVAQTTPVTISGTHSSVTAHSPELLVTGTTGQAGPMLSSFALAPTSIVGGASITAIVTLTAAAPSGGALITLASSNSKAVPVPATITIAAGATSGMAPVPTNPQSATTTVNVTASMKGESLTSPLTLTLSGGK
jgi:hypothetical protein